MSAENCTYPALGRFKNLALVLADDCGRAIGGPDSAWVEQCPGALDFTDDIDEGNDFERRCADDSIFVSIPGKKSLKGIDVNIDLHGLAPEFAAQLGGTPVMQGADIVGWDDCISGEGNLQAYIWQDVAGGSACDPNASERQFLLTIFPWLSEVRITRQGTFGAADSFIRITGRSRTGHGFGLGGLPVMDDGAGNPECMEQEISQACTRRTILTTLPPPEECGFITVTPCEIAS